MTSSGSLPSWDLSEIQRRLEARSLVIDLPAAFERWRREGHAGDEHAFLDWVATLHAEEQVLVTEILPPRLAAGAAPTISLDATLIDATVIGDADATVVASAPRAVADVSATSVPPRAASARYVIVGEAGKGGMAVVHVARDLELMRRVALKQLAGSAAAHQGVQARFLREVQISAQLDHPNIVPVYGLEVGPDGVPAYAMKLVRGQTLDQFLREARAFHDRDEPLDEAHSLPARLEHFLKVCDAMAYAHDKGVVHRDLKPANVMIGHHNEIYVMDWGICRVLRLPDDDDAVDVDMAGDDADTRTQMGAIVGTARYMSPEQASGRTDAIGPASDQYSLGLILFEIVTLAPPYEGRSVVEVLAHASRGEVRPVQHAFHGVRVPAELAAIVRRATTLDPAGRYAHVRALAADIRRYVRGDEVEARPDTAWQKAQRAIARHRQAALTALVALVAVASIGTGALLYRNEQQRVQTEVRERAMLELVNHAAEQAALLQTRLLELQGELDSLASTAALALARTAPSSARFYWIDDFQDPARQPPDLIRVDGEPYPQSFSFGAWIPAAGVDRRAIEPTIARLQHVRHHRNELFERARVLFGDQESTAPDGALPGSGIDALMTGLAVGVTMHLPSHAGLPRVRDPRQEPWYRLAAGRTGAQWGEPYLADSGRVVVPVSQAIRTDDGHEVGVASVLLSLEYLARNLLTDAGDTTARATVLLDTQGRVIGSHGLPDAFASGAFLRPFPDPGLLRALAEKDAGYVTTSVFGQVDALSFGTVHSLDWSVIKVSAVADAIEASTPSNAR